MKTKGRRKSKNVIVKDAEHIVSRGPEHDLWVMDDRGSFGRRYHTKSRLDERSLSSIILRNPNGLLAYLVGDEVDRDAQAYYNKPGNRLTNLAQLLDTAKPGLLQYFQE